MKRIIEICCGSYEDALAAYKGNADRIELNSALFLGGLTPSVSSLVLTKKNTDLKVIVMIRNRGAGFNYNNIEFEVMMNDAKIMLENDADGIAFGFLDEDKEIDVNKTKQMVELIHSYNKKAVFHRAFDCTNDPYASIEKLIELKVDRILTSGKKSKAVEGKELLKNLQEKYGEDIEILAGSGVNASNGKQLLEYTGLNQIHSSCKGWENDVTTKTDSVDFSYASEGMYDIVEYELVKELVNSLK